MRIKIKLNNSRFAFISGFWFILSVSTLLFTVPQTAVSQLSSTSFLQNFTAMQSTNNYAIIAGRNRLNSQFTYDFGSVNLHSEVELRHQYSENSAYHFFLRELYADIYTNKSDIRLGYQRVFWGRSQGGFVTDILSPFDLGNLTYSEVSEVRNAILALNINRYFGANSLQFILLPLLSSSTIPEPGSRWFPVPSPGDAIDISLENEDSGRWNGLNAGLNFRLRTPSRLDTEFYLLYWRYPIPTFGYEIFQASAVAPPDLTLKSRYNSSFMAGSGAGYQLSDRLSLNSEFLFVLSRSFTELPFERERILQASENNLIALQLFQEFHNRDDLYTITRPWLHSMFGIQGDIAGLNFSLQTHFEWIFNHTEKIISEPFFPYFTILINHSMFRDRLQLISLNRYNPVGNDFWLQLESRYELSDLIELSLGTNLFGGAEPDQFYGHLSFHQFRRNSFIFSKITLYF